MGLISEYGDLGGPADVAKAFALWFLDTYGEFPGGSITEAGGEIEIDTDGGRVVVMVMAERERLLMDDGTPRGRAGYTWLTNDERKVLDDHRKSKVGN